MTMYSMTGAELCSTALTCFIANKFDMFHIFYCNLHAFLIFKNFFCEKKNCVYFESSFSVTRLIQCLIANLLQKNAINNQTV